MFSVSSEHQKILNNPVSRLHIGRSIVRCNEYAEQSCLYCLMEVILLIIANSQLRVATSSCIIAEPLKSWYHGGFHLNTHIKVSIRGYLFRYYNGFVNMTCSSGFSLRNGSTNLRVYCGIDGNWIYPDEQCLSK